MAHFVRIISALFTRMQSNLVYDGVALKEEGKLTFQLDHNLGAGHCHTPLIVRSA
jgi:hypothetical protein